MLSIGPMKGGDGRYYLDLAQEDYYLDGGEPPGRWWGSGAEKLELTGMVERDQLKNLLAGLSLSGDALTQNAGRVR